MQVNLLDTFLTESEHNPSKKNQNELFLSALK